MSSELAGLRLRLYALCGVIAPVFFTVMVIVEGFLVTGYSHMTQQVSDLARTLCTVLMLCFRT